MAYPSMCFLFALLFATTAPLAHGSITLVGGITVAQVYIGGRLVCSSTGNSSPGTSSPGVSGVGVTLSCNGGRTNLAQAVTNTTGFFDVVLSTVDGAVFDPSACFVDVKLPVVTCTFFPPTGTLRAALSILNIVQSVMGQVCILAVGGFQNVPS